MNKRFHDLDKSKQMRIINAGLEVFAKNEYKHAVTDDIAAKADISKGLLFYYFHNKQELYNFLLTYVMKLTEKFVLTDEYLKITDFFELIEYAAIRKIKVVEKYPYLIDFAMKAYFSSRVLTDNPLAKMLDPMPDNKLYARYFTHIDTSRFKKPEDLYNIMQMLSWTAEGYLLHWKRKGKKVNVSEFVKKFQEWCVLYKRAYYKEEYQ